MNYKVIISPQADKELEDIAVFIAKDNPERAIAFVSELLERIEGSLTQFPYIGRACKLNQRMLALKGYIVFY